MSQVSGFSGRGLGPGLGVGWRSGYTGVGYSGFLVLGFFVGTGSGLGGGGTGIGAQVSLLIEPEIIYYIMTFCNKKKNTIAHELRTINEPRLTVNLLDADAVVRVQREPGWVDGVATPIPGVHQRVFDRRVRQAERVADLVRRHEEQTRS